MGSSSLVWFRQFEADIDQNGLPRTDVARRRKPATVSVLHASIGKRLRLGQPYGWRRDAFLVIVRIPSTMRPTARGMCVDLPLDKKLTFGVQTIHRRSEPAADRGCRTRMTGAPSSNWSTGSASIRSGAAITSPFPFQSSIPSSNSPRPPLTAIDWRSAPVFISCLCATPARSPNRSPRSTCWQAAA